MGLGLSDLLVRGAGSAGDLPSVQDQVRDRELLRYGQELSGRGPAVSAGRCARDGHLFITFLALSIRFGITKLLDGAGLLDSYSPEDVLDVYAAMKTVTADAAVRQTVPKDVRELDARLKLFMYSTPEDPDRLNGIKKKRGRKPKASGSS